MTPSTSPQFRFVAGAVILLSACGGNATPVILDHEDARQAARSAEPCGTEAKPCRLEAITVRAPAVDVTL